MGCGVSSIHLARIRMNISGLNQHLYNCNIVLYKNCLCNVNATEDVDHFFWICPRYESHRQTMVFDLNTIVPNQMPISITKSGRKYITSVIVNGDTSISVNENLSIFHIVERYINNKEIYVIIFIYQYYDVIYIAQQSTTNNQILTIYMYIV